MPLFHLSLQQVKRMSLRYIRTLMLHSIEFLKKESLLIFMQNRYKKGTGINFNGQELGNLRTFALIVCAQQYCAGNVTVICHALLQAIVKLRF